MYPDFVARKFQDIDFSYLHSIGVKALFIDLDGTVVSRGQFSVDPAVSKLLGAIPQKVYIATNRPKGRDLKNLVHDLNADGSIHPHGLFGKPTKKYFLKGLHDVGYKPQETAMVGDRYLQDILGANWAGMYSVAVMKWDAPANRFDRVLSAMENTFTKRIIRGYATK